MGRKASCFRSLPPHWSKASRYSMSLCLVCGKTPSSRVWQGMWSLTLDKLFLSLSLVLSSQEGTSYRHCLSAISQCLVQGTRHTAGSSPVCNQNCVAISSFYLSALDFNLEVEDILYLITIFLILFTAVEFLFEISCEMWGGGGVQRGIYFHLFHFVSSPSSFLLFS